MGADCCSSGDNPHSPAQDNTHHHSEPHHEEDVDGCCDGASTPKQGEEYKCCDDDNCDEPIEDVDVTSDCARSVTLSCCNSDKELCDEKCILTAAALECEKTCEQDKEGGRGSASHQHEHGANGEHLGSACSTHLSRAFDQYSAYLESARCICRSILERGWSTSCCDESKKESTTARQIDGQDTAYSTSHGHQARASHHHHGMKRRGKQSSKHHHHDGIDHIATAHGSGFQGKHQSIKEGPNNMELVNLDIEKAEALETVTLSVEGMTCSGCGNKMERTLNAIPGVSGVRVNFVMGNAEFSVDTSLNSPDEVIRGVHRATGFRCTRLTSHDQTIDLLASGVAAKSLSDVAIPGVVSTAIVNKNIVRITYDPTVIGARTLFDRLKPLSTELAPPRDDPSVATGRKRLYDQLIKTAVSAVLTIPVVVLAWGDNLVDDKTRAYVSIVLASLVQLIAVPDFYRPAISALVHSGSIEMDMLVVLSITAAYGYSIVAFAFRMADKPLETSEFFETSTLLITLVLLGRLVATFARIRAVEAVSLRSLQASVAVIVENGQDQEIDARLLQYGDKLKILPHTIVPTDALVTSGSSEIDESMLTGESVPVLKREGDAVIAGTVNTSGTLLARLTRLPGRNTVTDIAELVEEAANSKPKLQDLADRIARWFVPIVSSVAIIVFITWLIVNLKVRHYGAGKAVANAITYAVATLAISCPCALGLAVPLVLVVAGGVAARNGVVIKSAECTERARKVTDIIFDKTGTITEESMDVTDMEVFTSDSDEAIAITKALVSGNKHPVSKAVAEHLALRSVPAINLENIHSMPGSGVESEFKNKVIRAGNAKWTGADSNHAVRRLQENGRTILAITSNTELIALFGLHTRIRTEATKVISQLGRRSIAVHLVSGDQKGAVDSVAAQVGITNVASQCTPAEKREYVASLMSQGKTVMFVGDGTNDAVAVAQANVGVQLGSVSSASDVTRGAADVVLLAGLEGVPFLLEISRVSFRLMVINCVWSLVYNVLAILLAAGALVRVRISPSFAGLGEIVSVLPVVIVSTTMLFKKIRVEN